MTKILLILSMTTTLFSGHAVGQEYISFQLHDEEEIAYQPIINVEIADTQVMARYKHETKDLVCKGLVTLAILPFLPFSCLTAILLNEDVNEYKIYRLLRAAKIYLSRSSSECGSFEDKQSCKIYNQSERSLTRYLDQITNRSPSKKLTVMDLAIRLNEYADKPMTDFIYFATTAELLSYLFKA